MLAGCNSAFFPAIYRRRRNGSQDNYKRKRRTFMKAKLATAIAALDRVVNYFIPPAIAADREARNRAHVFLVSHILGPIIGSVVPITIYLLDPARGFDVAVLATSIVAFWVFPFALRAGAPYNPLALVSIEN